MINVRRSHLVIMSGTDHSHPCMFTTPLAQVQRNRYTELNDKLQEELNQEPDDEEDIWRLDLLTWVHYQLGDLKKSLTFSDLALEKSKKANFVSIGNRIYVLKKLGKEDTDEIHKYTQDLGTLSEDKGNLIVAKAQQGYSCLRHGGATNLQKAIDILEKIINDLHGHKKYLTLFYLGLSYRRLVHPNTLSCTQFPVTLEDYVNKAVKWFYEVIEKSNNSILKARAYSELVVLYNDASSILGTTDCMMSWNDPSIESLCDKALESGESNAKVLICCGRILCLGSEQNVRKGVELLTKAVKLKTSTTGFHGLAVGYIRLAELEQNIHASSHGNMNMRSKHDPENPLIKRAIEYLKKAITISAEYNLPAIFDLGKLLKSTGKSEEGLVEFNRVIESDTRKDGCFFLVIDSLEHAGLCLLELQEKEVDTKRKKELTSKAEHNLMLAVGFQTQLVNTVSALRHLSEKVWQALRTLKTRYECEEKSPIMIQKLVKLLGTALEHKEVLKVINTLSSDDIVSTDVAEQALKSFLAECEFTDAFAFLNMLNTLPNPVAIDTDLALQVKLNMAESLMNSGDFHPRYIFKTLFYQQYVHSKTKATDVLIVFDESHDTETQTSHVTEVANQLSYIFGDIFGLETGMNLNNSALCGVEMEVQLREMMNSKLVFLLLGVEPLNNHFEGIIQYIPSFQNMKEEKTSVVVSGVDSSIQVPTILFVYKYLCLENILQLQRNSEIREKTDFKLSPGQCKGKDSAELYLPKESSSGDKADQGLHDRELEAVDRGQDQSFHSSLEDVTSASDSKCFKAVPKEQKTKNPNSTPCRPNIGPTLCQDTLKCLQQNIQSSERSHLREKLIPGKMSKDDAQTLVQLFEFILKPDK